MLIFVTIFGISGLWLVVHPRLWVEIVKRDRPELNENDPRLTLTARILGVFTLGMALFVLWKGQ